MKQNIAATILSVVATATMLTAAAVPVSATSLDTLHEDASSLGKDFKKKWSVKIEGEYGEGNGTINFSGYVGYDTFMVNEDYIKSCYCPSGYSVQGRVESGSGKSKYTDIASGEPTGKADVWHFGNNVDYWIYLTE